MPPFAPPSQRPAQIFTLVVWLFCAAIGGLGLVLHHPWPQAPAKTIEPVTVQIAVELPPEEPVPEIPPPPAADLAPAEVTLHPSAQIAAVPAAPPPPLATMVVPDAPALTPVAAPNAAIPFAVPVAGPTRPVAQADAGGRAAGPPSNMAKPGQAGGVPGGTASNPAGQRPAPPRHLVFGEGEGRQDKPEYPREALRRRQEGVVGIRFIVDESGRVIEAEIASPCNYPLLNLSALDVVKKSWRFPAGDKRLYDVSIRFQMSRD